MLRTEVSKEAKISDTMVLLRLFNYQGALTVRYHRQCSFYRRRLFAAYFDLAALAAGYCGMLFPDSSKRMCQPETRKGEHMEKENLMSKVYNAEEIQQLLGIGRSKTYDFLDEVNKKQAPFRVIKIGRIYRVPKDSFDRWIDGEE